MWILRHRLKREVPENAIQAGNRNHATPPTPLFTKLKANGTYYPRQKRQDWNEAVEPFASREGPKARSSHTVENKQCDNGM